MTIITTYFANLRNLPENAKAISIANSQPKGICLPTYSPLIPPETLVREFKAGRISWETYIQIYVHLQLAQLNKDVVMADMKKLAGDDDIIYWVCWEGKGKPCHRHLAALWFGDVHEFEGIK